MTVESIVPAPDVSSLVTIAVPPAFIFADAAAPLINVVPALRLVKTKSKTIASKVAVPKLKSIPPDIFTAEISHSHVFQPPVIVQPLDVIDDGLTFVNLTVVPFAPELLNRPNVAQDTEQSATLNIVSVLSEKFITLPLAQDMVRLPILALLLVIVNISPVPV